MQRKREAQIWRRWAYLIVTASWVALTHAQESNQGESRAVRGWVKWRTSGAPSSCNTGVERDGFRSIQVNVDARGCNIQGDAANEPSIVVDPTNPRRMSIGWRQFNSVASDFREPGWGYSQDGGRTWVFGGSVTPGEFGSDPVLAANAEGVFYYLSINDDQMQLFRSRDSGQTWPDRTTVVASFTDKPWMSIDTTNGPGHGNIYVNWEGSSFAESTDAGLSFLDYHPFPVCGDWFSDSGTSSIGPNGELYIVGYGVLGSKSKNVKTSAEVPKFFMQIDIDYRPGIVGEGFGFSPNPLGLIGQTWIVADSQTNQCGSNVYVLAHAVGLGDAPDHTDVVVSRSSDGGQTWGKPVKVSESKPPNVGWQWFGTMSVAPNGRIDVVWNDSRNYPQSPGNKVELFYSFSTDGGDSWAPNVPVSPMFDSWVGWPFGQQKIGDYYTMVSDNLGANVAYSATFNGEQDIYFLRIGPWDCNGNEVDDAVDISSGASKDCNTNQVPDECEYRVDIDGDGLTTMKDYALLASALAGPLGNSAGDCAQLFDANHDGHIDLIDYAYLQRLLVSP